LQNNILSLKEHQDILNLVISEYPIQKIPEGEIDGFVNLVFNGKLKESDIQNKSKVARRSRNILFFQKLNRN
jgi:hypothetical protein